MIQQAISEWGNNTLYIALDTSMLWNSYCIIRISIIYRGRAVPIVWKVIEHSSSAVKFDIYKDLLEKAARLLPLHCNVVFLADRGFADTNLMQYLTELGWHWRIRIKNSFWIHHLGRSFKISWVNLLAGQTLLWHNVSVTNQSYGPVNLAIGRSQNAKEYWIVLSDEATDCDVFEEYGLRFDIEENFLDDKSNGFQLESSQIRSAKALERLCFLLAMATLYLVSQGTDVVQQGKRRWVDPHWFRGNSYLKIGWNWVKTALIRGYKLITKLHLSSKPDPEPALASRKYERTKRDSNFIFFTSQMN